MMRFGQSVGSDPSIGCYFHFSGFEIGEVCDVDVVGARPFEIFANKGDSNWNENTRLVLRGEVYFCFW